MANRKAEPTPGPWKVIQPYSDRCLAIVEEHGEHVALVYAEGERGPMPVSANAALIAAAPTLLDALQACLDYPDHGIGCETEREARAAIAAARGTVTP